MKLNKLIALLLAAAMLFAFVGCPTGNDPENPVDNSGSNTPATPAEDPLKDVADIKNGLVELTPAVEAVGTEGEEGYVAAVPATYVKAYKITDVEGLKKLAEIVNGKAAVGTEGEEGYVAAVPANSLAGYTFTVANDINIQAEGVTVLKEGFLEPDEGENGTANPNLVNLDSIGSRKLPFCGTFDGNNKIISGLYIFQAHQGLGFIGSVGDGAVVKNVILRDACVINANLSGAADGSDDDRFGLLIGSSEYAEGAVTIENCIVEGVIGSEAAKNRTVEGAAGDQPYEYASGILGEVGKSSSTIVITIKNCIVFARNYTGADKLIVNKERVKANQENNTQYTIDDLEAGKAAIDAAVEAARK